MTASICVLCDAEVEKDNPTGVWIDPRVQDDDNAGLRCPGNDDGPHEVITPMSVPS